MLWLAGGFFLCLFSLFRLLALVLLAIALNVLFQLPLVYLLLLQVFLPRLFFFFRLLFLLLLLLQGSFRRIYRIGHGPFSLTGGHPGLIYGIPCGLLRFLLLTPYLVLARHTRRRWCDGIVLHTEGLPQRQGVADTQ